QTGTDQTIILGLKPGDKAWVVLELPGEAAVHVGKVIEVGAEADFASGTRRVRVELANAADWPAGIQAWVRFTAPEGEWAKRIAAPKRADAGVATYRLGPMKSPEVIEKILHEVAAEQTKK